MASATTLTTGWPEQKMLNTKFFKLILAIPPLGQK